MKKVLLILMVLSVAAAKAQNPYDYFPSHMDFPLRQKPVEYEWPYIMHTPPYIGLIAGLEGFKSRFYQMGIALNASEIHETRGGVFGTQFLYQRQWHENVERYQVELGFYTFLCMGLNFNRTRQDDFTTFGVKPFVGISLFNIQALYGFNLYNRNKNQIDAMQRSSFELRYVIPIIPLSRNQDYLVPADYRYPEKVVIRR